MKMRDEKREQARTTGIPDYWHEYNKLRNSFTTNFQKYIYI